MAAINANTVGDYTHSQAQPAEAPVEETPNQEEETPIEEAVAPKEEIVDEVPNTETTNDEPKDEVSKDGDPWSVDHLVDDNGLVAGKYKNIDAMAKSLEHAEAKLVELQAEKQSSTAKSKNEAKAAESAKAISDAEHAGMKKYMESGRQMTPEIAAEVEAAGGNVTAVELKAIKASQHMDKITSMVGGEDTFNTMITDMSEGKTQSQKDAWLRAVSDPTMSEYAVKGLHAEWLEKTGQRATPTRISGKPANQSSVKPFTTQSEITQASARARNDRGFRAEYEARKRVTPDSVFFSR